jgi:SAM-dependent methyltransferase
MSTAPSYWLSATEDEAMQEDHRFVWEAMLEGVGSDLAGRRVLDVGCNRGGFLRLLSDRRDIGAGFGYDPAAGAIADARRLAGERPLQFEAAERVPAGWGHFDVAFSHEVLYLIPDVGAHAESVYGALAPGGSYDAVMRVHAGSPLMVEWHRDHGAELNLPPLHDADGVVASFAAAGFEVAVSRLKIGFVPLTTHSSRVGRLLPREKAFFLVQPARGHRLTRRPLRQLRTSTLDDRLATAFDLFRLASTRTEPLH